MTEKQLQKIIQLRKTLHACPEIPGREYRTRELLQRFLKENTGLELLECGDGFYAAHRGQSAQPGIALRADYDAVPVPDGGAAHLCGHDGHAAALCGVALQLDETPVARDVFLLFQPAEETGAGAASCVELFQRESVGEIYGAHNLPGFPFGQVTTRTGTFACASRGLILRFVGKATHAAYPEYGISPAPAVGRLLCDLPELARPERYTGMTLCTVIGARMGEQMFGSAAAEGEVWLTLRGEHDGDLDTLHSAVVERAQELAALYQLAFTAAVRDAFPATENHAACTQKVLAACDGVLLAAPMRWSEDFGYYLRQCPGAFFGIGAGAAHPALHTEDYEYPDDLLLPTVQSFWKLILA